VGLGPLLFMGVGWPPTFAFRMLSNTIGIGSIVKVNRSAELANVHAKQGQKGSGRIGTQQAEPLQRINLVIDILCWLTGYFQ